MKHLFSIVILIGATLCACGEDDTNSAAPSGGFSGKVVETMNTAGYTYLLVDTGSKKMWAAAPQFAVKVGDSVSIASGMAMPKYHSKSLNRDFDVVYFTGAVTVNGKSDADVASGKLPPNHPPLTNLPAKAKIEKVDLTGITPAKGGLTIAEIYAKKSKLAGKKVKLRGKVVKYNAMILGKNWLHLQDGTGSVGENDLVVTTASEAKVGDTVLVTGIVSIDKDLGSGYRFKIMIDGADVVVE